jgi:hypothetical protein
MKLPPNSASRLPGPSGNQLEKVHGKSEERYTFAKPSLILRHLRNHTPSSSEDRVKCSLFHLAAYTYEVNQAGLSAQLFPGSIITGLRMADNKRGEGT